MFNLFKKKNKIKELETRILVLESNITALNVQKEKSVNFNETWGEGFNLKGCTFEGAEFQCEKCNKESSTIEAKISDLAATPAKVDAIGIWPNSEDVGVINYECVSPKVNRIIHKVYSSEGNESIVTFENGDIKLSVNKAELKEPSDINGNLVLQMDGAVIGKIALEQLNKMQRQGKGTLISV